MSGSDGELGSRDGKVRWRGGVSDAEVNEGCVVREESEDVGSEGRAEVRVRPEPLHQASE